MQLTPAGALHLLRVFVAALPSQPIYVVLEGTNFAGNEPIQCDPLQWQVNAEGMLVYPRIKFELRERKDVIVNGAKLQLNDGTALANCTFDKPRQLYYLEDSIYVDVELQLTDALIQQ